MIRRSSRKSNTRTTLRKPATRTREPNIRVITLSTSGRVFSNQNDVRPLPYLWLTVHVDRFFKAVLPAGQRQCSETPVTRLADKADRHHSHYVFSIRISSQPSGSRRPPTIYNRRLSHPILAPLRPSSACHPAPHFHFESCPFSHRSVAGL